MTDDDAQLVALIDNELDEDSKGRLLARLNADDALRRRYEALRDTGAPIAASLAALAEAAPMARLRATLASTDPNRAPGADRRASPSANLRPESRSVFWSAARRRGSRCRSRRIQGARIGARRSSSTRIFTTPIRLR